MPVPRPRRQRTPEEIAKARDVAMNVMANQKKNDGLEDIKKGRTWIFVTAGLYLLSSLVVYYQTKAIEIYIIFAPLVLFYILLGIFYFRNPLVISWIALGVFATIIFLDAIYDPKSIVSGIIFKILIIGALISSIKSAKKYKDEIDKMNKPKAEDDILDEEMMESL